MASNVTELIWHFAGYLRLPPDDQFHIKILYDGAAHGPSDLDALKFRPEHNHYDVTIGPISPGSYVPLPQPDPLQWRLTRQHPDHKPSHPTIHLPHYSSHLPHEPPPGGGGGGGNFDFHWNILVTYQTGGDDNLINVHQLNALTSDNQMNAPADVFTVNQTWAGDVVAQMLAKAPYATPGWEEPANNDTTGLQNFVNFRDSSPVQTQAADAQFSVSDGQYVNGSPYSGAGNVHQLTDAVLNNVGQGLIQGFGGGVPQPQGNGMGLSDQTTSVGENLLANQALVGSFAGGTAALAVMGNYNETNSIIQANIFNEVNHFSGHGGTFSLDPNIVANIADFQNIVPSLTGGGGDGSFINFAPWHVSVVGGSFLDVHSLTQTNYLNNDNVVFQQSSAGIDQYVLGNNELVNTAQFQNFGSNYNLIIVEGNYHQYNMLSQTNVVLDSNHVRFGGKAGGQQSVTADGNTIINDGTIVTAQNQTFKPFNQSAHDVVNALTHGQTSLDPNEVGQAFPGFSGGLNVLVVTGDYYDINYVSQMNVLSNSNAVRMHGAGQAHAQQNLITGHNEVVNAATLVDAGSATSPYLQGNFYSDMILFQTNILGSHANVSGQDPTQLAPELPAFVTNEPAQLLSTGPAAPQVDATHHNNNDVLASVMH
jgi:hypothetical protein